MNKNSSISVLFSCLGILMVTLSMSDKFLSLPYVIKMGLAFVLIITATVIAVRNTVKKLTKKNNLI